MTANDRTAVLFSIGDDDRVWPGFADGETWNGFDQIYVTPETRDAIAAYCLTAGGQDQSDDLNTMPLTPDGLVDMVGWQTVALIRTDVLDDERGDR